MEVIFLRLIEKRLNSLFIFVVSSLKSYSAVQFEKLTTAFALLQILEYSFFTENIIFIGKYFTYYI